jgi:hypothetical protein
MTSGQGNATISDGAQLELGAGTSENVLFSGNTGTLKLDQSQSFTNTVAGLASGDSIDLANFQFSNHPTISNVTGSGNVGSTTKVTVTDGALSVTLALLNQYMNQFAVNSAAYSLAPDHNNASNNGTLFQLARPLR